MSFLFAAGRYAEAAKRLEDALRRHPQQYELAYSLGQDSPLGGHLLMIMSIGAVLEGSIFGDHVSPISDTTVLSSTASASDHVDHVRTQAPYAISVMLIALLVCYLPCAMFGTSPWLALVAGAVAVVLVIHTLGRRVEEAG